MKKTILLLALLACIVQTKAQDSSTTEDAINQVEVNQSNLSVHDFLINQKNYQMITLEKLSSGHIIVPITLNGVSGNFLIDTGAGRTLIDKHKEGQFNLNVKNKQSDGAGAGGNITLIKTTKNSLQIGSLLLDKLTIYMMDLDHVNNMLAQMDIEPVDGIIGSDILTEKQGIIDYNKLVLYLKQ